ncbi:MAG TPA: LPS export ABC transporter permease LptF [Alphaproteobacteria bacterium]|nr:LPS export ABC transporter permease LptF [Alphaproteobacteria bacterium]
MKGLDRYVLRQILASMAFIAVAVTSAIYLSQSLRLIDLIVNRGVSFATFLLMTVLMLPNFLVIVLPISLFSAVAFVYNRLTTESELVVMRAIGLSQMALAKPALLVAVGMTVVCYGLTTYLMPASFREFKELQFHIRSEYSSILLQEGVFNTIADNLTVYVRGRSPDGQLEGILVHDERIPDKPVTAMAESGAIVQTAEGPRVIMVNGNRQEVAKDTGKLSLLYFDRYTLDVSSEQEALKNRWLEPRERFLSELFWPTNDPDDVLNYYKLKAEGHQRLISPLYALSFAFIALALLVSGEYNRRGQARPLLIGTLAVVVVQAAGLGLDNLAARMPALVPLMYANALLPILGGWYLLIFPRRARARFGPSGAAAGPG